MRLLPLVVTATLALSACTRENDTIPPSTPDPYADSAMNMAAPAGSAAADSALAPSTGPADLTGTVGAFERGITTLAPAAAAANVEAWITTLTGTAGSDQIVADLRQLKSLLTAPSLDGAEIGETLKKLGQATTAAAPQATASQRPALERLAFLLTQAGTQLDPN